MIRQQLVRWMVVSASVVSVAAACGTGSGTSASGSGSVGVGGAGGTTTSTDGAGGASGPSSSSSATAGVGGSQGPACPGPKLVDPAKLGFKACPSYVCQDGGGHCVPNALVGADVAGFLEKCNKDSLCVPDPFIETQGNFLLATCESIMGYEGRCLSTCIPMVQARAAVLEQATCGSSELCVPCYDPVKNESTGVCDLTCDKPAEPKPAPLPTCCGNRGTCVAADIIPDNSASQLGKDSCPNDGSVCAPNELIDDMQNGTICQPSAILIALGVDTGVCVPDCVPAVKGLGNGSCPSGYNCAPCDVFGANTGACGPDW